MPQCLIRRDHDGMDRLRVLAARGISISRLVEEMETWPCVCPGNCTDPRENVLGCLVMRWAWHLAAKR